MAEPVVEEKKSDPAAPDKGQPTVLVIHQDVSVADSFRAALGKHGFVVDHAGDGNEGLNRIYSLIPDVIIAGSSVPELNGYQICRLVKHDPMLKKIPVLLVSDVAEKMDRFWGVKAGADDLLSREELPAKLLKKIQMVLEIYERMDISEKNIIRASQQKSPLNIRTRLNQILDISLVESTLMVEFRSLSDLVHDTTLLNYMLFSLMESIMEYDAATIFYNDDNKGPRVLTFHVPDGRALTTFQVDEMAHRMFEALRPNLSPQAAEMLETEIIGNSHDEAPMVAYQTQYFREIHVEGKLIGALALYSTQRVDYPRIFPVQLVENELRLLMKLRHLYSQAEMLAITDSLTGLFNHRHFMMTLQREFKSSQRYELDLSLAIIGVDNFKQLNDEWGHACGDEILRHVAKLAEQSFRSVDIAARFGGKYLAVVFPKTPADQTIIALERFQRRVSENPVPWQDAQLNLTVSVGLVAISAETESASALIKQAEEALQAARQKGSNRIEISSF